MSAFHRYGKSAWCLYLLVGLFFLSALSAEGANRVQGWIIYQRSRNGGEQVVCVTPGAVKVISKSNGVVTLAKAPDWKVCTYNSARKVQYITKLNRYICTLASQVTTVTGVSFSQVPFVPRGTGTVAGMKVLLYSTPQNLAVRALIEQKSGFTDKGAVASGTYAVDRFTAVEPQVSEFLARYYGVPQLKGLPIEYKYSELSGDQHFLLFTKARLAKTFDQVEFAFPRGYRDVKSDVEVANDASKGDDLMEFMSRVRNH